MNDQQIIEMFFARNEDAIRHTDDTYGRRLFALAERIVKNDVPATLKDTFSFFAITLVNSSLFIKVLLS